MTQRDCLRRLGHVSPSICVLFSNGLELPFTMGSSMEHSDAVRVVVPLARVEHSNQTTCTMKPIAIIALFGLAAVPATAANQVYQKDPGTTNRTGTAPERMMGKASALTQTLTTAAASGNALEVETCRLAVERARNADVKSFPQMMIGDHAKVGEQMKASFSLRACCRPPRR